MREHGRPSPQEAQPNRGQHHERIYDWKEEGFDLKERLGSLNGPFIEIAGPTIRGFKSIDVATLKKKVHVSNITPGISVFDGKTGEFSGHIGKIDFRADAKRLPFADETVGAVFCACLSAVGEGGSLRIQRAKATHELRREALQEVSRVLQKGGLLIWEGGETEDFLQTSAFGFILQQLRTFVDADGQETRKDMVFEKAGQQK